MFFDEENKKKIAAVITDKMTDKEKSIEAESKRNRSGSFSDPLENKEEEASFDEMAMDEVVEDLLYAFEKKDKSLLKETLLDLFDMHSMKSKGE